MDVVGKVTKILEPQKFNTKNGEGIKYGFILRTNEQYPKNIHLTTMDGEKWARWGIQEGEDYSMGIEVSSREWQGRWFTECKVWRVVSLDAKVPKQDNDSPAPPMPQQAMAEPKENVVPKAPTVQSNDDLPF